MMEVDTLMLVAIKARAKFIVDYSDPTDAFSKAIVSAAQLIIDDINRAQAAWEVIEERKLEILRERL